MKVIQHTPDVLVLQPRRQGIWMLVGGLIFAIAGLGFVFLFGSTAELTCERTEPKQIQCEVRKHILGLTLQQKQVEGLRGSKVIQKTDSDGDRVYQIVLLTSSGDVPLQNVWSSGYGAKEDFSTEVNQYVQDTNRASLSVQESGGMIGLLFTSLFVVIGLVMAFSGVRLLFTVWIFDRSGGVVVHQINGIGGARVAEYPLDDVFAVDVGSHRSSNSSSRTYRIVLYMRTGDHVPLTKAYTSGYGRKAESARVIQEFLGLEGTSPSDPMETLGQFFQNR